MLTVEVAEKTPFGNEILQRGFQRGIEKGIEEGMEKGFVKGEQASIRLYLQSRFPTLAAANLDHLSTPDQAHRLLQDLYAATTEDQARHALGSE